MDKVIENVDYYLAVLPERTQNGEPYGINMMPCNRSEWRVCYYSHYSKNYDDRFGVIVKNTLPEALHAMYQLMLETCPAILKEPPATPATSWEEVLENAKEFARTRAREKYNWDQRHVTLINECVAYEYEQMLTYLSQHWPSSQPVSPTPMAETWEESKLARMVIEVLENKARYCCDSVSWKGYQNGNGTEVGVDIDKVIRYAKSIINSAPSLHQVDRWVRVEDGLPDPMEEVTCYNGKRRFSGYMKHGTWWYSHNDTIVAYPQHRAITHWQHLPAAPETDKK